MPIPQTTPIFTGCVKRGRQFVSKRGEKFVGWSARS